VIALQCRSLALWALGYPEAAFASAEQALDVARGMRAAVLMPALPFTGLTQLISGDYAIAKAVIDELIVLAEEKGTMFWNAVGMLRRASLLALAGKPSDAVSVFTSVIPVYRALALLNERHLVQMCQVFRSKRKLTYPQTRRSAEAMVYKTLWARLPLAVTRAVKLDG
jgi:hypothetical protein